MNGRTDRLEQAYEDDARRWLRVYPPRWRRAREDEVLGVLLDLRPPGAARLSGRARLDLVRGSLGFRRQTRLPFVTWLLWRFGDVTPGPAHREWLLDHTDSRFAGFRAYWVSLTTLFLVAMVLVLSDFGREPHFWAFAPLLAGLGVSLLPRQWWARRLQTEMLAQDRESDLAGSFDRAVPWRPRTRWAWGARVLLPGAGLAAGSCLAAAVVLSTETGAAGPGSQAVALSQLLAGDGFGLVLAFGLVALCGGSYLVQLLASAALCRRRVLGRPDQPWRAPLTPLPWWLVLGLTTAGLLLPSGLVLSLLVSAATLTLTWAIAFLLLAGSTLAVVVAVVHVRVARALRDAPGPPVAVVDVLNPRGGDQVPVDVPKLLQHRWVGYPPSSAPDGTDPASPGHH